MNSAAAHARVLTNVEALHTEVKRPRGLEHVRTEMRQHNLGAFDLATEAHGHPLGVGDGGRKERCV